ncbi:MAG: hypothetical protein V3W08_00215 [Candidatus Binatia bacterium]|jgi:K+-sensing histidine kinase KdpD
MEERQRKLGKGTGLGLSIPHGIVADQGGKIRYEPAEGGAGHFLVSLPIAPVKTTEAVGGHERDEQKYAG